MRLQAFVLNFYYSICQHLVSIIENLMCIKLFQYHKHLNVYASYYSINLRIHIVCTRSNEQINTVNDKHMKQYTYMMYFFILIIYAHCHN
ncbi:hypothetical protein MtrunA17_Chr7g0260901 [Medicago truncatula]|uniref:Uncharacterized protein n=1 Tax=Medicago truncatula TaxID=3880 RepID=A0A396H6M4_MEDTR|nr:hypothetical protein MtrunA17_Chr7g0260901 [Medicago truncatula]